MSMIVWGKRSHQQVRVSQGVMGGKTSPTEPTLEGADIYDAYAQEYVHEETPLELLRCLEGYKAPISEDPEKQERSFDKYFEYGLFSKELLLSRKISNSQESKITTTNNLIGNIRQSETEWDSGQIDMSIFASADLSRARKVIMERMAKPRYIVAKDNGNGIITQIPLDGDRTCIFWGNHIDQDRHSHLQFYRHHHVINNKKLTYNPNTKQVVEEPNPANNRYITQATSLDKDNVRAIELEWINEGLREAKLPTIDRIYLSNEEKDNTKSEAKKLIENEAPHEWVKRLEEDKKEITLDFDPSDESKAILAADLKLLDEVIKEKKSAAAEYLAKAIKEKNEVDAFEKAQETVVLLHKEKLNSHNLSEKLSKTENTLAQTAQNLEDEVELKNEITRKLTETSFELTETSAKLGKLELDFEELEEKYYGLDELHKTTIIKHQDEVKALNIEHAKSVEALENNHKFAIDDLKKSHVEDITKIEFEHEQVIEDITKKNKSIVEGLTIEIEGLNENVSSLTEERDSLKLDKEGLNKEVAKLKSEIERIKKAHEEQLIKEREDRKLEKQSLESVITEYKAGKINLDKVIAKLNEDKNQLITDVQNHIDQYKALQKENVKLKADLGTSEKNNVALTTENAQLKTDRDALKEAIEKDLQKKQQEKNKNNKNKPE